MLFSELRRRQPRDGNELATRLQSVERLSQFVSAQAVQYDVVVLQNAFEVLLLVVDDNVRSQRFNLFNIICAGGRRNEGAQMLGELDGDGTDATQAGVDKDLLTLF